MSAPVAIWDFDGTLGHRRHGTWAECLLEVLDAQEPGHPWTRDQLFDVLAVGFPWHAAERPHPHLHDPDTWWGHITTVVRTALTRLGISPKAATTAAEATRAAYTDPAAWSLYPQAVDVLDQLTSHGWRHVLLSNHVPELPLLLQVLDLEKRLKAVLNSAATGYEKPHPIAFRLAQSAAGNAARLVMVGDNPKADAAGACRAGIDAIWVRRDHHTDTPDLGRAARILRTSPNAQGRTLHEVDPLPTTPTHPAPIR
ncbi:hypothetical protein T261_0749 [Streptomyces lydicus]|nr:hypothetical protein T261_0749 [Streptomyces lydicus]